MKNVQRVERKNNKIFVLLKQMRPLNNSVFRETTEPHGVIKPVFLRGEAVIQRPQ